MAELTDQDRNEMRELIEEKWVAGGLARDWDASMAPVPYTHLTLPTTPYV